MVNKIQCERYVGKWIEFQTQWGRHRGVVERVTDDHVVVLAPRNYIPVHMATAVKNEDLLKHDITLAWGPGYGIRPGAGASAGANTFVGPRYGGYGGFGGYPYGWGRGWARWAVSFLIIFALFGLWW